MQDGERQVAPTIDGIRRDHVARYEWVAKYLEGGKHVLDIACGVGYGTQLLAVAGHWAWGFDCDKEAIEYARGHYPHARASYAVRDVSKSDWYQSQWAHEVAVCFEAIEHIKDPAPMLRALNARVLFASVPNEEVFPYRGYKFHYRHYTKSQFEQLLCETGWRVLEWYGQTGPDSEVGRDVHGRTLIAVAVRADDFLAAESPPAPLQTSANAESEGAHVAAALDSLAGKHVAILGLGPSLSVYENFTKRLGGRRKFCDETWGINALGDVFNCDRIFHMDDVRIQDLRAQADPNSNIATMLKWVRTHSGPIYTSRTHPDYPGLVEFPLEEVINNLNFAYFNSTAAYAVGYAIYAGVKRLSLFGMDFTYPNAHHAEKGRANVEFLLGIAAARGIKLDMPTRSSLMDACHTPAERLYGYDTLDVIQEWKDGRVKLSFRERETLPTVEEIEKRYDHSRHPSPLIETIEE